MQIKEKWLLIKGGSIKLAINDKIAFKMIAGLQ